jgi:hypothetical protein
MSNTLVVYKNRRNVVPVSLGVNLSTDTITSEIRTLSGVLIATWSVTFDGDGTDGELVLTLDDSALSSIPYTIGLMDLKRVSAGEPLPVFDKPLEVEFREAVTV